MDILGLLKESGVDVMAVVGVVVITELVKRTFARKVPSAKRWMPWIAVGLGAVAALAKTRPLQWQLYVEHVFWYAGGALSAYAVVSTFLKAKR